MELRVDKVLLLLPLPLLFMPTPPLSLPLLTLLLLLLLVIPGALWTSKGSFVVSHRPERACLIWQPPARRRRLRRAALRRPSPHLCSRGDRRGRPPPLPPPRAPPGAKTKDLMCKRS